MILRSTRKFDEVEIHIWSCPTGMMKLEEILRKFQDSIKKITLRFAAIDEYNLMELLALLPNLEEIVIDASLYNSGGAQQRLTHLRFMRSFTCKVESAKIIFDLPQDVLTKLSFSSVVYESPPSPQLLQSLFEAQRNLKELNFDPAKVGDGFSMNLLDLKHLRLASNHQMVEILKSQKNLIDLNIKKDLTEEEFVEVCGLKQLQVLDIKVGNVNATLLHKINNLKDLKKLLLITNRGYWVTSLCNIELKKLEKLELSFTSDTNIQIFLEKLPTHFPTLKNLKLTSVEMKSIPTLLLNKNLESLEIEELKSLSETNEIQLPETSHEKLKEFKVGHEYSEYLLDFITCFMPNVFKLSLRNFFIKDLSTLKHVLGKKRLTHLSIFNRNCRNDECKDFTWLMREFVNLMKDQGQSLTYFEFENVKLSSWDMQKLNSFLKSQFAFIYYENSCKTLVLKNGKWN